MQSDWLESWINVTIQDILEGESAVEDLSDYEELPVSAALVDASTAEQGNWKTLWNVLKFNIISHWILLNLLLNLKL
jgi:hypothetical protein